jgi:hypothetical protein
LGAPLLSAIRVFAYTPLILYNEAIIGAGEMIIVEIKSNENLFDRFVKMLIGAIVTSLAFLLVRNPLLFLITLGAGLWLIITGAIGYCPLYDVLGITTKKT